MSEIGDRFWSKVDRDGPIPEFAPHLGACWVWTATRSDGYGLFFVDGAMRGAHRVSYELVVGPIPEGLRIDHLCRVRHCVNPEHLEAVTHRENVLRGAKCWPGANDRAASASAAVQLAKTHCPEGHPYLGANLYVPPGGGERQCRECRREATRRWRQRDRARRSAA